MRLKDRVALITGGGAGIGRATALLFAREGARVVIDARSSKNGEETVGMIKEVGGEASLVVGDVSRNGDAERMVRTTIGNYGRLNILVNNAGTGKGDKVTEVPEEDWDKAIDVNLKGVFLVSRYAIREMIKQGGGCIINISSIRGLLGNPSGASYCSSKGGVVLLTKQMAVDYAGDNIRVNCICPGFVDTKMFRSYTDSKENPKEALRVFEEMAPLGRIARAEEVAYAILFLASDDSSFITGVALPVDGGYTANAIRRIQ